jgi:hypothetical protein
MVSISRKITHEGELDLNGIKLSCYVLEDGSRILSARGMQTSLRLVDSEQGADQSKIAGAGFTRFVGQKWFKALTTSANKLEQFKAITCYKGNQRINGYQATMLADFCDIMLDARKNSLLKHERHQIVAAQCEVLVRALAKVGIIALVDEATGYQYDREKDELQKILKAYISEELLKWQKRFPDEFYKEIFRLNGWGDLTVSGLKAHQRPGVIGTWTKKLVYQQLPKGVLQELYRKTPKTSDGRLAKKLHQSLTMDVGNPHLEKQLVSVITLMNISNDWKEFTRFFNKKFGQQEIEFSNDEQKKLIEPKQVPIQVPEFDRSLKGLLNVPPPQKDVEPDQVDETINEDE